MNELWDQLSKNAGIALADSHHEKLSRYLDLLLVANARMNLTRISDRSAAEIQHIADALTLLPFLPAGAIQIADIGSGGGVPAIPLAIVRSNARFTLIESTKKKAAFLRQAAEQLALTNVTVIDSRVEDVGRGNQREIFDAVTARAVAEMAWLAEWGLPLLKKGGRLLAMKGPKAEEELRRAERIIARLGGVVTSVKQIEIAQLAGHVIAEIEKVRNSPREFPRAATEAKGRTMGE